VRHFDDATPIYLQIAEEIRAQILSGELAEGARLISTTEYATRYRINPATANKAVALLVDEGLVVKRRGIGMFVVDGALTDLRRSRRAAYTDDVLHPALDTGLALGLDDAELRDAVVQYLESHARKES
jgi:transcriptional regulator, gntR family protein